MYNPFSLDGKIILVTGASSGIGKSTAIECSKLGATVIALGRNTERLQETYDKLETKDSLQFSVDLTQEDDVKCLLEKLPKLDGVVNAAGIASTTLFQFATPEKIRNIFEVNFFAPVEFTRLLLKKKLIRKGGSIVFFSSVDGPVNVHIGNSTYSATKSAIASIARGMAVELASKGIRVNYLMPGQTETPLIHGESITQEQLEQDMKSYPMGRYARPEEIAYGAIYFLSDASTFTTGTGLVIDGGFTVL
jgi:NAD(P)-dependent dehydrogenase (short-subunit alcohol dehydrogenase family)